MEGPVNLVNATVPLPHWIIDFLFAPQAAVTAQQ